MSSSTAASILVLGRKSTTYSAPRYSSVCPFWRPKPFTSVTVMPCTPIADSASRTSSSLNGLMMAVTSFMVSFLSERLLHEHGSRGLADVPAGERVASVLRRRIGVISAEIPAAGRRVRHADLPVGVVEVVAIVEAVRLALEFLPAHVRVQRPLLVDRIVRGQVEVPAVVRIRDAECVAYRMRVLERHPFPAAGDIQLRRVRPSAAFEVVARLPVGEEADIHAPATVE